MPSHISPTAPNTNSNWLPDKPAFAGLHPDELNWQFLGNIQNLNDAQKQNDAQPSKVHLDQILIDFFTSHYAQFLNEPVALFKLDSHHPTPYGFYRLQSSQFHHFLKVVKPSQAQRHQQANAVSQWLSTSGLAVATLLEGFPIALSADIEVLGYDYIHGHFCWPSKDNMRQLGSAIAKLHKALKNYPQYQKVKAAGLQRHAALQSTLQEFKNNTALQSQLPEPVAQILLSCDSTFLDVLIENAQMVHGDLNMGNVWLSQDENGQELCHFLDFEDSLTAWFNPLKDLAFVLERFVLTHDDIEHEELGVALFQTYFENCEIAFVKQANNTANNSERVTSILQALAVRALLLLMQISKKQNIPLSDEWKKFVFLFNLTTQKHKVIENILCKAAKNALNY